MLPRLALIAFFVAVSARPDTLRLRNGTTVNGSFLGGSAGDVQFLVNDEVQHYARADVAEIDFNSGGGRPANRNPDAPIDLGPDVANAPYMRGANGYIPLEREIAQMSRGGGGMYGMGGSVYRVQGPSSPVRVRQGDRIVFVVRFDSRGGDPRQFQLFRLQSRMGYRQTQPAMGGAPPGLPLTINRVNDSVYEIIPARPLQPGEYAVSPMNSNESYCFGVDY